MILAADQNMKNASASEKIAKTRSHTALAGSPPPQLNK
jgi:hypothetical protein